MPSTKRARPGKRYNDKRVAPVTRSGIDAEMLRLNLGLSREATDALVKEAYEADTRCIRIVAMAVDAYFDVRAREKAE